MLSKVEKEKRAENDGGKARESDGSRSKLKEKKNCLINYF